MHESWDEFEIGPDSTTGFPWQQIGLEWEKRRHHVFSKVFDRSHFILAGNDDIHKSLNSVRSDHGLRSWLPLSV